MKIKDLQLIRSRSELAGLPAGKLLIDTINAHSFVLASRNLAFENALLEADVLLPDGISIVKACKFLHAENTPDEKIAGADLFDYEMGKLNEKGGVCFFLGSTPETLALIEQKAKEVYPNITVKSYSPPFRDSFSRGESEKMVEAVNEAHPDLLWVGMTAPKQEKWLYDHWNDLDIDCHAGAIGAVFDFFAGTVQRAPQKWIDSGFEWLYRLIKEPRRTWRRYLVNNPVFCWLVLKEKITG